VNGYLIAGLDAPGTKSGFCYPPELLEQITSRLGEYQVRQHPYKATPETYLPKILGQCEYILGVAKYLKKKEPWDFFMVVLESTDLVQHFYWHYAFPEEFGISPTTHKVLAEALLNVYRRIDEGLNDMLSLCGPDENVIVMSDHGFSPCRKIFFMDNWLRQEGYLSYREKHSNRHAITRALHLGFQRYFPNTIKGRVTSLIPGLRDRFRSYLTTATIDWAKTQAFSLGIDSTNIFINVKGRFPQGVVNEGREYEALRDEIADKMSCLVDPDTGERIVQRVFRREDLYHGDCFTKAPDLLVTWKNFEYNTRRGYGPEADCLLGSSLEFSDVSGYSSLQKSGTHHVKGVLMAMGNAFKSIPWGKGRIIDLAPTILYLLDEPIPEDMDGRVMEEIIEDSHRKSHPVRLAASEAPQEGIMDEMAYGDDEAEYVKEKLQGLGYID
jgi:predicted AlkP superfamily phosphohydrolase/phosphomutase